MRLSLVLVFCAVVVSVDRVALAQLAGLDARPANPTCTAPARPGSAGDVSLALEREFGNRAFPNPVGLFAIPGRPGDWILVLQGAAHRPDEVGEIWRLTEVPGGPPIVNIFLDLGEQNVAIGNEAGVLGLAIHPDFGANPYVYLSYTMPDPTHLGPFTSVVERYTSNDQGLTADLGSRVEILRLEQPAIHHQAGGIAFGPDGYLYLSLGDGGIQGQAQATSQDTDSWFGSMLRLDVDSAQPYAIPPTNPFATGGGAPEIFAWGLRNPWRWSFDSVTGDLWVGDVGFDLREEVDLVTNGGNYGWPIFEGDICWIPASCNDPMLIPPLVTHRHADLVPPGDGRAVIGGYVYRGTEFPELAGHYIYGDVLGNIWNLAPGSTTPTLQLSGVGPIRSMGQGPDGEIYAIHTWIDKIVLDTSSGGAVLPATLSETGCFDPANPKQPLPGLIPYTVNVPLWSDGAEKDRWMALPDGQTISLDASGDFDFPNETVLIKNFRVAGQLVETRFFVRHEDGGWAGYSYEWNEAETEAFLLDDGKTRDLDGQIWTYPSRLQCFSCHTSVAGDALGPTIAQLNRYSLFPQTGRDAQQLRTFESIGLFTDPLPNRTELLEILPGPDQLWASTHELSRAYLDANCSNCHQPGGATQAEMDLRWTTPFQDADICLTDPVLGDLGIPGAKLLNPGDPNSSIIWERMNTLGADRMPPLATSLVDSTATDLVANWVNHLVEASQACLGADSDGDGWLDTADFCPTVANAVNLDSDGDGLGDVCQCGDVTGDQALDALDLAQYRRVLAGVDADFTRPGLCNTWEDGSPCDLLDVVVIARRVAGLTPSPQRYCVATL